LTPVRPETSRLELLLSVYATERSYNMSQLQMQLAIVTAGLTYIIAVSGLVATKCLVHHAHGGGSTLPLGGHGCRTLPHAVLWATPLPLLALLGFLTLTQALLDSSGAYISAIEDEVRKVKTATAGELVVPQFFSRGATQAYRRLPSLFGPVIAYLSVSAIVIGFLVVMLQLMPWEGAGAGLTKAAAVAYGLAYLMLGSAFVGTTLRLLPIRGWGYSLDRHAIDSD
jgi:hypothetical protein